jgi:hypothetical protein
VRVNIWADRALDRLQAGDAVVTARQRRGGALGGGLERPAGEGLRGAGDCGGRREGSSRYVTIRPVS